MRSPHVVLLLILALIGAGCNRDPKVQRQKFLENGNRYFDSKKYKEASIMYRRSIKEDARFGEAHYRLGLTSLRLNQPVEALRSFQRAVELDPNNEDAPAKVAEIFLAAYGANPQKSEQFLKEIEDMTKRILDRNPKSFDGFRLRGYLNLARKDVKAALADFQSADQLKPNDARLTFVLAQTLVADNQMPVAEAKLKEAIEKNKGNAEWNPVYEFLYGIYMRDKRLADAEKILQQKLENNAKDPLAYVQLASHYFLQGNRPGADALLKRLLDNPKDFPKARLIAGQFYFRVRDFDRAMSEFQAGLAAADAASKPDYQKQIVQVMTAQGRISEALALTEEIVKANPKDDSALAIRGALALRSGQRDKLQGAINDLQASVNRSPENPVLRFEYARALMVKGEVDQARVQLLEAVKLRPDFLPAKLVLAQIYILKNDFPNAMQMANQILELDKNNVAGRLVRSSAMIGMREYVQARQELNAVLAQYPEQGDAQYQLGMLNFQEGKFREAESVFRRLFEKTPQDQRALAGTIEALVAQGQFAQALQMLNASIEKEPNRTDLRAALANTAYRAGNYDLAIGEYQKLIEKDPQNISLTVRLGEVYRRKGDMTNAVATIQKAHSLDPNSPMTSLTLAMLYDAMGQADKSRPYYEKVLATEPDNPMALNNLAFIMAEQGADLDQALTMVQKAKQKLPNNAEVSDTLGWIYIKKNLSDSAIGIFRDLTTKYPERSTFHYHLAMAYFQKGDRPQAKKLLETALSKKPTKTEETKIRELLARIG